MADDVKPGQKWEPPNARLLAKAMRKVAETGYETHWHKAADALMVKELRRFGYGEAMDVFEKMEKWYE